MRIGVIGDIHYPYRSNRIPYEFIKWFKAEGVDMVVGTGDYNDKKVIDILSENFGKCIFVKGNTDFLDLDTEKILDINGIKILVFHGDKIYPRGDIVKIYRYAFEKDVDIIIFGHTHRPLFTRYENIFLLNPGSATNVPSGEGKSYGKSAAILEIDKDEISVKFKINI